MRIHWLGELNKWVGKLECTCLEFRLKCALSMGGNFHNCFYANLYQSLDIYMGTFIISQTKQSLFLTSQL